VISDKINMKKLFYLIYISVGVLILFQTSKLIGTAVERRFLRDITPPAVERTVQQTRWPEPGIDYDISMFSSPLFSLRQPGAAAPVDGEEAVNGADSPLVKSYELNGVIILPDNKSIALIRRTRERASQMYKRGDMIDSYELVKIERQRVLMSDGLSTSVLPMFHKHTVRTARTARTETPRQVESSDFAGAKQFKKVLSRSDVENRVFSKVNEILTQIAISPYMVNGEMQGLRLIRVPNESIVFELGGRSGDVIKRVNGHELDQVDQMYKLWENIKDDSSITVDLERKKQMFSYNFEIRE
jgi:type II secretion system protein C